MARTAPVAAMVTLIRPRNTSTATATTAPAPPSRRHPNEAAPLTCFRCPRVCASAAAVHSFSRHSALSRLFISSTPSDGQSSVEWTETGQPYSSDCCKRSTRMMTPLRDLLKKRGTSRRGDRWDRHWRPDQSDAIDWIGLGRWLGQRRWPKELLGGRPCGSDPSPTAARSCQTDETVARAGSGPSFVIIITIIIIILIIIGVTGCSSS